MNETIIQRWHAAVNAADLAQAQQLVSDPVVVSGPRGSGAVSASDFAAWMTRSGIQLHPVGWHPVSSRVTVVEQDAAWETAPAPVRVATVFRTRGDLVSAALRFPHLDEALAFARLYAVLAETE